MGLTGGDGGGGALLETCRHSHPPPPPPLVTQLSVDGLSTIADLKRAIRDATGVPADLQALFHHNPSVPGGRGAEVFLHDEMTVYHAIGSDHDPSQRHVVYLNVDESGGTEAAGKEVKGACELSPPHPPPPCRLCPPPPSPFSPPPTRHCSPQHNFHGREGK